MNSVDSPNIQALARRFPEKFMWGVGTASYQTEGGAYSGGRGRSIWDDFCDQRGRILNGATGETAADHFNKWEDDISLLQELGVNAYRFSISWSRIFPSGFGKQNPQGLDFYDRLVDRLCEVGIKPIATLFHWDLPSELQKSGGWMDREVTNHFASYAATMAATLGDRVDDWFTMIEPYILTRHSHILGEHAPGLSMQSGAALPHVHHLLLAHGRGVSAIRSETQARIGLTNHPSPVTPATDSEEDLVAATLFDALRNHMVPDAILLGRYPEELGELPGANLDCIVDGDMEIVSLPVDWLGLTYYHPSIVKAPEADTNEPFESVSIEGVFHTTMGWPVVPDGFRAMLVGLKERYGDKLPPIIITENGCSAPDVLEFDGTIQDDSRIEFLSSHLDSLGSAIEAGVKVDGYFVWSFLDHFEWDLGYSKRWGIVHVDFSTHERRPKASAEWYRHFIETWAHQ